jgi:hypothetical protein
MTTAKSVIISSFKRCYTGRNLKSNRSARKLIKAYDSSMSVCIILNSGRRINLKVKILVPSPASFVFTSDVLLCKGQGAKSVTFLWLVREDHTLFVVLLISY